MLDETSSTRRLESSHLCPQCNVTRFDLTLPSSISPSKQIVHNQSGSNWTSPGKDSNKVLIQATALFAVPTKALIDKKHATEREKTHE